MGMGLKWLPYASNVWKCTSPRGEVKSLQTSLSALADVMSMDFTCNGINETQILTVA